MDMEKAGPSSRNPRQQLQLEQFIGIHMFYGWMIISQPFNPSD